MSTKQIEIRAGLRGIELRDKGANGIGTLVGYAAVFNSKSVDMGFYEIVAPGAFSRALSSGIDVRALAHHDSSSVIGRRKAGTLRLEEDAKGLRVEIDLPDTSHGRDIRESVARGDLDGMSFGFSVRDAAWETQDGEDVRILKDVEVYEVSVVAFPAYEGTEVSVRSAKAVLEERREHARPPLTDVQATAAREAAVAEYKSLAQRIEKQFARA